MSKIKFEKESVQTAQPSRSLLGASLATSSRSEGATSVPMPVGPVEVQEVVAPELAIGSLGPTGPIGGGAGRASTSSVLGFRVDYVIKAVLRATTNPKLSAVPGFPLGQDHTQYSLRLAGDDGVEVDEDFPEIDFDVQLTSVGVEKFILTEAGSSTPVVRLSVPSASLQLRICELGVVDELPVSCIVAPVAAPQQAAAASSGATSSPAPASSSATGDARRGSTGRATALVQFQVKMRSPESRSRGPAGMGAGGAGGSGPRGLAETPAVAVTFGGARSLAYYLAQYGVPAGSEVAGAGGAGRTGLDSGVGAGVGGAGPDLVAVGEAPVAPVAAAAGGVQLISGAGGAGAGAVLEGKRAESAGTSWGSSEDAPAESKACESSRESTQSHAMHAGSGESQEENSMDARTADPSANDGSGGGDGRKPAV